MKELETAIACFNRGDYFGAAERFENLGRNEDEIGELCGALDRVACAFHQRFFRGGRQGAINLLSQAMLLLDGMRPARAGVDIERLCGELQAFTENLRASPRSPPPGIRHRARLLLERRRAPKIRSLSAPDASS